MAARRIRIYIGTAVLLGVAAFLLGPHAWRMGMGAHTAMETVASVLAAFVALIALVRYYAKRDSALLFVGTAFAGTAVLDANHAVITSALLSWRLPGGLESVSPWSWLAGRTFLPLFLLVGYAAWRNQARGGPRERDRTIFTAAGVLMVALMAFFVSVPLPQALFPGGLFGRPQELLPGTLFVLALAAYLRKGRWRTDVFEHWLVLSLIVGASSELGFALFSEFLSDPFDDAAHLLKIVSYGCVLVGSVASTYRLFRAAEGMAEEALEANERLLALDRAKTEFVGVAAHELRSPLTSIAGFAQLLDVRWDDLTTEQRREMVGRIHEQTARLVRMANDLLAMSRIDAGALEPRPELIEVEVLARQALDDLGEEAAAELEVPPDLRVHADPGHVRQMLVNYLTNANRYGRPPVRVEARPWDDGVEIAVADRGAGVPAEFVPHLFERFARAEGTIREGTGLGLAIVRGLAEANRGQALYEPNDPQGSRFVVRLPCGTDGEAGIPFLDAAR